MTPADAARMKIVAFGDSLVAGFGVKPSEGFVAQLEAALKARGHDVEIVNSGVSGDTALNGLERFDWAVPDDARAVILEFGANDGLTGKDPAATKATLDKILNRLGERKLPVLIAGMKAPRNWGEVYTSAFDGMYADLASKHGALIYPFFLEGVALERELNLGDGMHPNAKGVAEIVRRITPKVEELIGKALAVR
jgi:acyl-CoA thioesterase-1